MNEEGAHNMEDEKYDVERMTEIIDEMLEKNEIVLQAKLPAGSMDAEIKSNVDELGPTGHFYILLHVLKTVFLEFAKMLNEAKKEEFIDGVLMMVKGELMEADEEETEEDETT